MNGKNQTKNNSNAGKTATGRRKILNFKKKYRTAENKADQGFFFAKIGLIFSAVLFLFFIVRLIYFFHPMQKITSIKVNAYQTDYHQIIDQAGIAVGQPYARWAGQQKSFSFSFRKNYQVSSVDLDLDPKSGKAFIKVHERVFAGFVFYKNAWHRLNRDSSVGNYVSVPDGRSPIYTGFDLHSDYFKQTVKNYFKLGQLSRSAVSQIILVSSESRTKEIAIVMNDGNLVYTSPASIGKLELYPQMAAVIRQRNLNRGVIDLISGNFARPFNDQDQKVLNDADNRR